jgi:hypothetical protein
MTPEQAFGGGNVVALALPASQRAGLGNFIRHSPQPDADSAIRPYADWPYPGSRYYASSRIYSALHTCNTWSAHALQAAGLPLDGFGVLFASQLWSQLTPLRSVP